MNVLLQISLSTNLWQDQTYKEQIIGEVNPLSTKTAKGVHFSILLCQMPDDFTCQGRISSSERALIRA